MIITQILNRSYSLIFAMRQRLYLSLLSGFCIIGACTPASPLYSQTRKALDIVRIQPFRLEKSYKFDWRSERPDVRSGLLVVIKVDTSLVRPTNDLQPVLYAGNQTVQRINEGYESGYVIGIIPAQIDLSKEPVWFGLPALPERINAKNIAAERSRAIRAGIRPLKADDVKSRTKDIAAMPDLTTLLRKYAADLILEFSPQEKHLVEAWRLPETRQ
jgi:hypothetical protein